MDPRIAAVAAAVAGQTWRRPRATAFRTPTPAQRSGARMHPRVRVMTSFNSLTGYGQGEAVVARGDREEQCSRPRVPRLHQGQPAPGGDVAQAIGGAQ